MAGRAVRSFERAIVSQGLLTADYLQPRTKHLQPQMDLIFAPIVLMRRQRVTDWRSGSSAGSS